MHKLSLFLCFICFLHSRINGQESSTTVPVTKTELSSFKDIKSILAAAYPGKDYTNYTVLGFDLSGSTVSGSNSISFTETSFCGGFTENQRLLIEKYAKEGMVFILQKITLRERGIPGTPYNPSAMTVISVPDILFTIKE